MQNELERYKNFDPTNAPVVKPNLKNYKNAMPRLKQRL
jgi:hypothetical protein